jgi:hypothetical protein
VSQSRGGVATSGETEAVVIVKAAPQISQRHGETVCCAGIDVRGNWLRIYPVAFRTLDDGQKFGRWDRIRFAWRAAADDSRIESRRIDQQSLQIVGELKKSERDRFLAKAIVTGLDAQRRAGKSLALLRPQSPEFSYEKKPDAEIDADRQRFAQLHQQQDLFNSKSLIPYDPCPFKFKYRYRTDDGMREGTCQDWEIETTFFKWSKLYGEKGALEAMEKRFGKEYPRKGMLLAMGTHSRWPETWLINGIVRLDETGQMALL